MLELIKNALRRNKLKKFVALALSIALWFFVMESQDPVINGSYDVPLTMVNAPAKFKPIFGEQTVRVRLRAPRSYFVDYSESNIRAYANLRDYASEGDYDIPVETSYPKGFELTSISPDTIRIRLDPFIERQIPAEIIVTGSTATDSSVKSLDKSSDNLTLIGAKTAVNSVRRVIGYIGLNSNAETFDIPVPLTAIDENGREVNDVRVVPSVITVTVVIESDIVTKTVAVNPIVVVPSGREIAELSVNPETIEVTGKYDLLNYIDAVSTDTVHVPDSRDTFSGVARLNLPDGVTSNINDVSVRVELSAREEDTASEN